MTIPNSVKENAKKILSAMLILVLVAGMLTTTAPLAFAEEAAEVAVEAVEVIEVEAEEAPALVEEAFEAPAVIESAVPELALALDGLDNPLVADEAVAAELANDVVAFGEEITAFATEITDVVLTRISEEEFSIEFTSNEAESVWVSFYENDTNLGIQGMISAQAGNNVQTLALSDPSIPFWWTQANRIELFTTATSFGFFTIPAWTGGSTEVEITDVTITRISSGWFTFEFNSNMAGTYSLLYYYDDLYADYQVSNPMVAGQNGDGSWGHDPSLHNRVELVTVVGEGDDAVTTSHGFYDIPPLSALSDSKDITSFVLAGVAGEISGTHIIVMVPYGTDVTALTPVITHTGVSISPTGPQDFTPLAYYTVTAEDGSTKTYMVIVDVSTIIPGVSFGTWTGSGTVSATIQVDVSKFFLLQLDGQILTLGEDYLVAAGSTVITLTESYLSSLYNGSYIFVAYFFDGAAQMALTVNVPGNDGPGDTGGNPGSPGVPGTTGGGDTKESTPPATTTTGSGGDPGLPTTGDNVGWPAIAMIAFILLSACCFAIATRRRSKA